MRKYTWVFFAVLVGCGQQTQQPVITEKPVSAEEECLLLPAAGATCKSKSIVLPAAVNRLIRVCDVTRSDWVFNISEVNNPRDFRIRMTWKGHENGARVRCDFSLRKDAYVGSTFDSAPHSDRIYFTDEVKLERRYGVKVECSEAPAELLAARICYTVDTPPR